MKRWQLVSYKCTDTYCEAQFHTWLTTGIPDGQPKLLLSFLPYEDFPLLNFAMATASASSFRPY